ncbi:MAG TPA: hypothetical protein VL921_18115 [Candidatus Udaeobacter sp.]|nr:hypothetical protein [Candidatus Udaeobacter sp.]
MAIGILCDDIGLYNEAVDYFKNGDFNGRATYYLFPTNDPNLAQSEESGRDQPHNMLGISALTNMAHMSFIQHQGNSSFEDLYEHSIRLIMEVVIYFSKYNNGGTVSFTLLYTYEWRDEQVVSPSGRAQFRPIFEMVWNHYHYNKGVADGTAADPLYYTKSVVDSLRPEPLSTDHHPFTTILYAESPILSGQIYTAERIKSGRLQPMRTARTN